MGIFLGDRPVSVFFNGASASLPVQGVFLGGIQVFPTGTAATVPGAPTIAAAFFDDVDFVTTVIGSGLNNGADVTSIRVVFSESGEPTPLTDPDPESGNPNSVLSNADGSYSFSYKFSSDFTGETVQVFATNSVGEGEGNTPVTVIDPNA
jgi:hypothetical protein